MTPAWQSYLTLRVEYQVRQTDSYRASKSSTRTRDQRGSPLATGPSSVMLWSDTTYMWPKEQTTTVSCWESLRIRASLSMGAPFLPWGTWYVGGGSRIQETLIDECSSALVVGQLSARDSIKGTLREGSFPGEPERWCFWETCKIPCRRASLVIGAHWGTWRGFVCRDFWETNKVYLGSFLDQEAMKILSLGAIWNFSKGTGLSWVDIRLWGKKGPSIMCIGTVRARTQC